MTAILRETNPSIPTVLCPMCGDHMRLATCEPTEREDRYRMTFDCVCDFKFQVSEAKALVRNGADVNTL